MKANIITPEQAKEFGLKLGSRIIGRSVIMRGDSEDDPGRMVEEQLIRENDEKELVFMAEERRQSLKKRKAYSKYIKQFATISAENVKQDIN